MPARRPARLRETLARRVREIVKALAPGADYRHRIADLLEVREVQVEGPPIRGDLHR